MKKLRASIISLIGNIFQKYSQSHFNMTILSDLCTKNELMTFLIFSFYCSNVLKHYALQTTYVKSFIWRFQAKLA